MMTKIDIFSGFLGAGKTTLIKKLITEAYAGEKVVLIENEFGDIGIDGGFLRKVGIEINEMNSGCICCSLVGDFSRALCEVAERFHPDRILIEPSGVGKLSDVVRAVRDAKLEGAVLNAQTTVVDAKKCKMYMKNFGEFFGDQIANATTVVFSHTDAISEEKLAAALDLVREHNATATVVTTPWDKLDGKQILSAMEKESTIEKALSDLEQAHHHDHHHHNHGEDCTCGCHDHDHHEHHHHDGEERHCHEHEHHHDHDHHHDHGEDCTCGCHDHDHQHEHHHHHHDHDHDHDHGEECTCGCHDHDHEHHHHHHHHHADEVFDSFGRETARKYTREEIEGILSTFATGDECGMILRAKGIVAGEGDEWIHFDYVPGEPDVRTGGADVVGRICVIGAKLDRERIAALFSL